MARPHLRRRRDPETTSPAATPDAPDAPDRPAAAGSTRTLTQERLAPAPPHTPDVRRRPLLDATPVLLVQAAHPRQGVLTSAVMTAGAALADRPTRELALVLVTVLVGQTILGWHNDLVDRGRDAAHQRQAKPVADGRLDPGTVWFALACAVLLVVPLAVSHGTTAGVLYLASLLVGLLGNVALRAGALSWLPWAAAFALYPAFLSYAGTAGSGDGGPPQPVMVVLAALLGVGVHLLTALWGLVADHEDGWTYLPLRLGMRIGAARLLGLASTYLALVTAGLAVAGTLVGLHA